MGSRKFHAWYSPPGWMDSQRLQKFKTKFFDTMEQAKKWLADEIEGTATDNYGINNPDGYFVHVSPRIAENLGLIPYVGPGDAYPRWIHKNSIGLMRHHNAALEQAANH